MKPAAESLQQLRLRPRSSNPATAPCPWPPPSLPLHPSFPLPPLCLHLTVRFLRTDRHGSRAAQAAFARAEIEAVAQEIVFPEEWTVRLEDIDAVLGAEAYRIEVADYTVTVTDGDAAGLMYG